MHTGNTAMHYCVQYGYTEVGDYIQIKGADDNIENTQGMTCYEGLGETPR
jgi:ankyrin repeat protein